MAIKKEVQSAIVNEDSSQRDSVIMNSIPLTTSNLMAVQSNTIDSVRQENLVQAREIGARNAVNVENPDSDKLTGDIHFEILTVFFVNVTVL